MFFTVIGGARPRVVVALLLCAGGFGCKRGEIAAPPPTARAITALPSVALVVGNATLSPGDRALRDRLVGLGNTVEVMTAATATATKVASMRAVVSIRCTNRRLAT